MANLLLTEHPRIWTYQYQLPLRPIEPFLVLSLAGLADLTLHSYITNIERTIRNSKFPGTLHFPRNPIHQIDVQSALLLQKAVNVSASSEPSSMLFPPTRVLSKLSPTLSLALLGQLQTHSQRLVETSQPTKFSSR